MLSHKILKIQWGKIQNRSGGSPLVPPPEYASAPSPLLYTSELQFLSMSKQFLLPTSFFSDSWLSIFFRLESTWSWCIVGTVRKNNANLLNAAFQKCLATGQISPIKDDHKTYSKAFVQWESIKYHIMNDFPSPQCTSPRSRYFSSQFLLTGFSMVQDIFLRQNKIKNNLLLEEGARVKFKSIKTHKGKKTILENFFI